MVVIYNLINFVNRALYWLHKRARSPRQLLMALSAGLLVLVIWKLSSTERISIPRWHSINSAKSLQLDKINIAVFEEHHEALAYWFAAADKGIIRKHGNTLVHIDSHPDLDLLSYDSHMSWFRYPHSDIQRASLIQTNDQFITGAMITGLVTELLWVFPDWVFPTIVTQSNEWKEGSFTDKLSIGWYPYAGKPAMCCCLRSESECLFKDGHGDEVEPSRECSHMISVKVTYIKASQARPLLEKATKSSYILDMDEDFYGVTRGSDLVEGITWWHIEELNNLLAGVFHPQSVYEEVAANDIMKDILHQILRVCLSNGEERLRKCEAEHVSYIYKYLAESGHFNRPIGGSVFYTLEIATLVHGITKLFNGDQMRILQRVGFCLNISPNTWQLPGNENRRPVLAVCHGRNAPNTRNQIRVFEDLTESKRVLADIVKILADSGRPGLVTVARSNRDGYVPRHQQPEIETHLLSVLKSNFRDINIIYDPSLMTHLGQNIITL